MRTPKQRAVRGATLLSLASLGSAIVLPPQIADNTNNQAIRATALGRSSVRKSLNWGPSQPSDFHSVESADQAIANWNAEANLRAGLLQHSASSLDVVGKEIANAFVESLHPGHSFRLVDGYRSRHNNLFHATFLQTADGIDIANANLNINLDLSTGEIVSYGDSSYAKTLSKPSSNESWKEKVSDWATETADQLSFNAGKDDAPQDEDVLKMYSSPDFNPVPANKVPAATDPRHGLLTFLAIQSPSSELGNILLSAPRHEIVDKMSAELVSGTRHSHLIHGVPSALEAVKANLNYVLSEGKLRLAWKYEILTADNQYEAYVTADSNVSGDEETLLVVDWVRDFRPTGGEFGREAAQTFGYFPRKGLKNSRKPRLMQARDFSVSQGVAADKAGNFTPSYRVFPWGVNAPDVGSRETLTGSTIQIYQEASPVGWHTIPSAYKGGKDTFYFDTRGNNVLAQDNPDGGNSMENYRAHSKNLTFDFPLHWPKAGTPLEPNSYIDAAITQLFYTNNEIHDLFFTYGFDEPAGNFQDFNFGRGGLGNDAVQANAQDGSGTNNANFATPPDGSRPRMRMYYWTGAQPYRDGDFEAGIVIHEYAHGISTRLTGGPANSGCLGWGEAGGMGEGWGDFFATVIRTHHKKEREWDMGSWASARKGGIRNFPYSLNMTTNPSTYTTLDKPGYWGVHAIGEVWAEMLWEVAESLIAQHGFSKTLFPPPANSTDTGFYNEKYTKTRVPKHGNTLALQLVIDGMKIQPCRPSFRAARDAIITADKVLTGGENTCLLWKAFAKRGLGPEATAIDTPWGSTGHTNDFKIPAKCKDSK